MDMKSSLDIIVPVSVPFFFFFTCTFFLTSLILGCNLTVAYEMNEHRKSGPYTYILDGALTDIQGSAPPNAIIDVFSA